MSWLASMYDWYYVDLKIRPLKESLAIAQGEAKKATEEMNEKNRQLKLVVDKVDGLKAKLNDLKESLKNLKDKAEDTELKKGRAEKLISGLGGEKFRWMANVEILKEDYIALTGDVLVSSGCIS